MIIIPLRSPSRPSSSSMLDVYVVFTLVLLFFWFVRGCRKPDRFPPGPPKVPLLGSLPFLVDDQCRASLLHLAERGVKKYGKVNGMFIGNKPSVFIADYDVLKATFRKPEMSSRPPFEPYNETRPAGLLPELEGRVPGMVFSGGRFWADQRKFAIRQLREFGFGKASMEENLHAEVERLMESFETKQGVDLDLNQAMNISVLNALWLIIAGETMELGDSKLLYLLKSTDAIANAIPATNPVPQLLPRPGMAKLPILRQLCNYDQVITAFDALINVGKTLVREHQETFDGQNPRDFIDVYLKQIEEEKDPTSSFYKDKGVDVLYNIILEMFVAGMETASSTLLWTFFYMVHFTEKQQKVQQELDAVVGRDRLPRLSDLPDLPYTNAVLHESLRLSGLVYLGLPHYCIKDTVVEGFNIPKGTTVFGNLFHIMRDPDYWTRPNEFFPERFLGSDGRFTPDERVIPFCVGKRQCPGQALAEKEFFLFFASIVQNFRLEASTSTPLPGFGIDDTFPNGFVRQAPSFKVQLFKRRPENIFE